MAEPLVLAIDQGTSATKCVLMTTRGLVLATATEPVAISYPQAGWVEQDPEDILASVRLAAAKCLSGVDRNRVAGVAFSTQRESALIWDSETGQPLGPLLGWQDRRAAPLCRELRLAGHGERVREVTGLPLDPMFSAAKLAWLLASVSGELRRAGRVAAGTVDSWLLSSLTGDHVIEAGNASRTLLLDVESGAWSEEMLDLFGIPVECLPRVVPSVGDLGTVGGAGGVLEGLPVVAVLGDSHAALHAHGSQTAGGAKVTYGTGSSVMRLLDIAPDGRVCRTIAWADPRPVRALEGNIRSSGATVSWTARLLGTTPHEVAALAATAESDGVHLVPAFGGLGAPWWDDEAVGIASGLTLGTGPAQLARAALESVAFQVDDVVRATSLPGRPVEHLLADGGASVNDVLMQLQADLSGLRVLRARDEGLSATGAAMLAARCLGEQPAPLAYDEFQPRLDGAESARRRTEWLAAVSRSRSKVDTSDQS